jgi:hypothetical protein
MDTRSEPGIERFLSDLGASAAVTVVTTVVFLLADTLLKSRLLSGIAAATIFAVCLLAWALVRRRRRQRQMEDHLRMLGVEHVFPSLDRAPTTLEIIRHANRTVSFMGISARTFFEEEAVEETLRAKVRASVHCRFLLLNPQSKHLAAKAQEEGDDPKAWSYDIDAGLVRLRGLGASPGNGSVVPRYYSAKPIWRLIIVDDARCYVGCYPHGHRGKHSPIALFVAERGGFFDAMCDTFERTWADSEAAVE